MKNKRGQLGLGTVKSVMIMFLILTVIAVTLLIVLPEIRNVTEAVDKITVNCGNCTTQDPVNVTGSFLQGTNGFRNCELTVTGFFNSTGATGPFTANNYSIVGCFVTAIGADPSGNNTPWNMSGSYIYSNPRTREMMNNVTDGTKDFFNSTGTIFAILVVVVIILAIGIIIAIVTRFGSGGVGGGSGKEFGSDTVMGI